MILFVPIGGADSGFTGAYVWFGRKLQDVEFRLRWDRWLLVCLVGDLIGKLEVARLTRDLGTLIGNGVTLLTALIDCQGDPGQYVYGAGPDPGCNAAEGGKGFRGSDGERPVSQAGGTLVTVGEETGKPWQEMLLRIADIYDREVR